MRPSDPDAVHRRFLELVIRATARAAREEREHLERVRALRLRELPYHPAAVALARRRAATGTSTE
jgi:hypothetical protein